MGVIITDGRISELKIPVKFIQLFESELRFVFKRDEWIGVHPLDPNMLSKELQNFTDEFDFIAIPKGMV